MLPEKINSYFPHLYTENNYSQGCVSKNKYMEAF